MRPSITRIVFSLLLASCSLVILCAAVAWGGEDQAPTAENLWRAKQNKDLKEVDRIRAIMEQEAQKSWRSPVDDNLPLELAPPLPPRNFEPPAKTFIWGNDATITTGTMTAGISTDYDVNDNIYAVRCSTSYGTENCQVRIYKSTDQGASWFYLCSFYSPTAMPYFYPVVLTGTSGTPDKLYVFFWRPYQNGIIEVARYTQDGVWEGFYSVKNDDDTVTYFSACANLGSGDRLMVAYQREKMGDATPDVYTIVSTDYGETWGGETWIASDGSHPDIAYGAGGHVYLTYEKTGGSNDEIYFGRSTNYCASGSWEYFQYLTSDSWDDNYPKVAALHTTPEATPHVWLAYNHDFAGTGNIDLRFAYSTNGGSDWSTDHSLAYSSDFNEMACDLWVGRNQAFTFVNICYLAGKAVSYYQRWYDIYWGFANTDAPSYWRDVEIINDEWGALDYDGRKVCQGTFGEFSAIESGVVFAGQTLDDNYRGLYFDSRGWTGALRGDANGDGIINVGDIVYLVSYLYKGGPPPDPIWVGDCNCDDIVNVGDVVFLVSYLYKGGPEPVC